MSTLTAAPPLALDRLLRLCKGGDEAMIPEEYRRPWAVTISGAPYTVATNAHAALILPWHTAGAGAQPDTTQRSITRMLESPALDTGYLPFAVLQQFAGSPRWWVLETCPFCQDGAGVITCPACKGKEGGCIECKYDPLGQTSCKMSIHFLQENHEDHMGQLLIGRRAVLLRKELLARYMDGLSGDWIRMELWDASRSETGRDRNGRFMPPALRFVGPDWRVLVMPCVWNEENKERKGFGEIDALRVREKP